MHEFPDMELLVFAKAPVAGQVKTRLLPVLDAESAADLHARLVEETLTRLLPCAPCPVSLQCAPDADHPFFADLMHRLGLACHVQQGQGLGERMAHAAKRTLERGRWPILIGTDCPLLDCARVRQACLALKQGQDAVLGPAEDGGYVLLGLRRTAPRLFRGMAWGGDRVLEDTRAALRALDWRWQELAPLWDLDRPADLERYRTLLRITG